MSKMIWPIVALLSLSACDSNSNVRITKNSSADSSSVLKVIDALQCPTDQGVLTRRGTASDGGQTCTYAGPRGSEVKLHLVPLNGEVADIALKRFQDELGISTHEPTIAVETDEATDDASTPERASVRMPGLSVDSEGDRATVALPGMKIEADGDRANIRIGGMVIRADDKGSTVTDGKGTNIVANGAGTVSINNVSRTAIRATLLHKDSKPSANGWRMVGYEARGPGGGPIVVATFRTRDRDEDAIVSAIRELVNLNVGD